MNVSDSYDGCDVAGQGPYTPDDEIPYVALFAAVDLTDAAAVEARRREWEAIAHYRVVLAP